jgi:uncharacterized membrane protein
VPRKKHFLKTFDSRHRLLISTILAMISLILLPYWLYESTRLLCVWNIGNIHFLALTWWTMVKATPQKMRNKAQCQYEGRIAVFSIIIAAACASVLAIGFILNNKKDTSLVISNFHVLLAFITIFSSWLLVHTTFTMQYAYTYYQDSLLAIDKHAGGLSFPNEESPDYWDFLYFSFGIGMTSQVSDVQTTSREMRKLTLLHGILSFFFNTTILALSINLIASLIQVQN